MKKQTLTDFLPPQAAHWVQEVIAPYPLIIKIKGSRKTKLGDYRKIPNGHQITINADLLPEMFLLTLTHEIAHMKAFDTYGNRIAPHGQEWKATFRKLLNDSFVFYPDKFQPILKRFAQNPKANLYANTELATYFHAQNEGNQLVMLKDLPLGTSFRIGRREFKSLEKKQVRYLCVDLISKRKYLINGLAPIDETF